MPPGDVAPVLLTSLLLVAAAFVLILRGPVGRALARRIEGAHQSPALTADVEERLARLEALASQVGELEERLDFAERLLARQRDASALKGGAE